MTASVVLVLVVLATAVVLFVTEWVRVDVVAMMVLLVLAISGTVTYPQALAGFSNPAVITIASVLILGGGLMRTGVANFVGRQVLRLAGASEVRLLVVMMVAAGVMSGLMNNIAVAALMLPAVLDIARRVRISPSKLLMPLAFSSLLGGLTTLIGTAPSILISGALEEAGFRPFGLFEFTPIGLAALSAGVMYMAVVGRRLLPDRDLAKESGPERSSDDLSDDFRIRKRLFAITVPEDSMLSGKTLAESHFGAALGLNVLAITRAGKTSLAPGPGSVLRGGDKLLVEGRLDQLNALRGWRHLVMEGGRWPVEKLVSTQIDFVELVLGEDSGLIGGSLLLQGFRRRFGVNILAIERDGEVVTENLLELPLRAGDVLLAQGPRGRLASVREEADFSEVRDLESDAVARRYRLHRRLLGVQVPAGSLLSGKMLAESRLGDAFGLTILGIIRAAETRLMPELGTEFREGDTLLIQGRPEELFTLHALQHLEVQEESADASILESTDVGMVEITLSPRSDLPGQSIRELRFRDRYRLSVVAIWRSGRVYRSNLRDMELRQGDALLVYGEHEWLQALARDGDFLVLTDVGHEEFRPSKAPLAMAIMAAMLATVMSGFLPIFIAAPAAATLMVLTGCLKMDDAYRAIEWRAIVLIAGMLSLGAAMQESGTASMIADLVLGNAAEFGPLAVVAALFAISAVAAQLMPTAAVAVLMSPIALDTAMQVGLTPRALMVVLVFGCSAAFMSPVGHPVNLLVMGLGGYRFFDYARVGIGLTVLLFVIVLVLVPLLIPLV